MAGATLIVVGVSQRTAGLAAREQAALTDAGARAVLRALRADARVDEALALSTCNRTELYAVAPDSRSGEAALREVLLRHTRVAPATLNRAGYTLDGLDAV